MTAASISTLSIRCFISGLSLPRQNEEDPSRTDLATGASTMYRYLDIERGSVPKTGDVMLLRKKQGVGVPRDGMV